MIIFTLEFFDQSFKLLEIIKSALNTIANIDTSQKQSDKQPTKQ